MDARRLWCAAADSSTSSAAERSFLAQAWAAEAPRRDRVLLSTCQRVELYGVGAAFPAPAAGVRFLDGEEAVAHLCNVAAGLESAVAGENEVLGQVRDALRAATARAVRDPVLTRLFEVAIATGRRCRAGRGPTGSGLAVLAARSLLDRIPPRRGHVLVVGAGYMGSAIANVLAPRCPELAIASRTPARAAALARRLGAPALNLEQAAASAPRARGLAIALSAPWTAEFLPASLPPTVDVSSPPAISEQTCTDHVGIDALLARRQTGDAGYAERARGIVETAVVTYLDSLERRAVAV
jgi:glutamyl-tRNA reductase